MRQLLITVCCAMAVFVGRDALGHGFRIRIDGDNKLLLRSDDPGAGEGLIYRAVTMLGPATSRSTDHPGYDVNTLDGPSGFAGGESIGFDALGPLWYSDGGTPVLSPAGVNMKITSQDLGVTGSVTVTGESEFQTGFLIGVYDGSALGAYEHQLNYQMDVLGGVPIGAFALKLQLTGANAASQPLVPSDPLVAVFNNDLEFATFAALVTPIAARAMEMPGDVNFDGIVDIFDVNVVSANWSSTEPTGDANGDHMVDIFDVNVISSHWGDSLYGGGGVVAVPEPSALALCGASRNRIRCLASASIAVALSRCRAWQFVVIGWKHCQTDDGKEACTRRLDSLARSFGRFTPPQFLTLQEVQLMSPRTVCALLLLAVVSPRAAWAHGLQMTFHVNAAGNFESDTSAFYGPVLDPIEQHDSVFRNTGSYTITSLNGVAISSTTLSSLQYTASPATSNPPATNGLAIGSTYGFNLVGPLVFWEPVLGITPTDVTATIVRSGAGFTVDKNTTFVPGGFLAGGATGSSGPYNGTAGFHNSTTVNIPLGSPVGLYAVGYEIRPTFGTTYGTSNRFYAIGTNGLSEEDFNRGINELAAAGVPEPSSIVVGVLGAAGAIAYAWRRRRRAAIGAWRRGEER